MPPGRSGTRRSRRRRPSRCRPRAGRGSPPRAGSTGRCRRSSAARRRPPGRRSRSRPPVSLAERHHLPDHLVPGRDPGPVHGQVALGHVQVGAAHPAGQHPQQQLTRPWLRYRVVGAEAQRVPGDRARHSQHAMRAYAARYPLRLAGLAPVSCRTLNLTDAHSFTQQDPGIGSDFGILIICAGRGATAQRIGTISSVYGALRDSVPGSVAAGRYAGLLALTGQRVGVAP